LNGFVHAGTAAMLIYHNRRGITACQENLSNGVFGSRRRFGSGRRQAGNQRLLHIQNRQLSGMIIAITLNQNNDIGVSGEITALAIARCSLLTLNGMRQFAADESHRSC
jgi:hypothetical protein